MYYETDYLSHYGVLGMKWGVRRYQNKDGTLTAEGKKRQSDTNKKALDPEKKQAVTSETALNHVSDYLDNKITEADSKKLEELWDNGNETFMKWYDNKDDSLKEQYTKDRDAAFEAYEKKSLEVLSKIIKENGNKELSDAIDKHYDSENPYGLYKSLLNEDESLANSFDSYSTIFDIMIDSYMVDRKADARHVGIEETDYLSHYGVLGMKWGVRRYQNKDGTLTEAGKAKAKELKKKDASTLSNSEKKLLILDKKDASIKARRTKEEKAKRADDVEKGKIKSKDMTNEEMQKRIARLKLEKDYNELLRDQQKADKENDMGVRFADKFKTSLVDKLASDVGADLISQAIKAAMAKAINESIGDTTVYANNQKKK